MDETLKARITEYLNGSLDGAESEGIAARLQADPEALVEFVDQVQVHNRLNALLKAGDPVTAPVLREIRLLGDSPRFSREVVDRVKRMEGPRRSRPWFFWGVAATFVAVTIVALVGRPIAGHPPPGGRALFVVGEVPPGPGDARVLARLEELGAVVTVKSAKEVVAADAYGAALVLISSTSLAEDVLAPAGEFVNRFRNLPVPVLTWEPRLLHDLGMIAGHVHKTDWGSWKGHARLAIVREDHPLAADLSGTVVVTGSPGQMTWGRARSDALTIATLEGDPGRAAIFGYEKGVDMPGLLAPARRLSFFLFDQTSTALTPEGWALFDAAVRWCARGR